MSTQQTPASEHDKWLEKVESEPSAELFRRPEPGQWITGGITVAVLLGVVALFANAKIDWAISWEYLFDARILNGLWNTIVVTVLSFSLGLALGVLFGTMRLSRNPVVAGIAWLYVWLFRGTPLLVQLLIWFNLALVIPTLWIPFSGPVRTVVIMTPMMTAVLGLAINEGAYLSEVIRGGIISVDKGQFEAAHAMGMSRTRTIMRIILPQAMPSVLPNLGNSAIGMLKTSSLASIVAYPELLNRSQSIYYVTGNVMELLFVAAFWYLVATSVLSIGQYYLERHYGQSGSSAHLSWTDRVIKNSVGRLLGRAEKSKGMTA